MRQPASSPVDKVVQVGGEEGIPWLLQNPGGGSGAGRLGLSIPSLTSGAASMADAAFNWLFGAAIHNRDGGGGVV